MTVDAELAERHYAEHAERPFFGELVEFITSGPIVAMVLEGIDAVKAARQVIGATNPLEAAPGTIRGDFAIEMGAEHGARLGLAGVGRARGGAVLRRSWPSAAGRRRRRSSSPRARPSGGRSWSAWASRSGAGPDVAELRAGRAGGAWRSRTRCARRAPCSRPRASAEIVLGCDTLVDARRRASTASRPTSEQARATLRALAGRTHEVVSGLALLDGERRQRTVARAHRGHASASSTSELVDWYVALGRVARAGRRLCDPGRRRGACARVRGRLRERRRPARSRRLLDLCPELLAGGAPGRRRKALRNRCKRRSQACSGLSRRPLDCAPGRARGTRRARDAARRRAAAPASPRACPLSEYGHSQLSDRIRRPRHGGRSRHRQHARVRARARHRAVRAQRGRDRLAHRRSARRRHRGQAHARPHARARSRRSGR